MNEDKREKLYQRYLKMFAPLYHISLCKAEEIEEVKDFIEKYWKAGHALTKSRELMDWQHYNPATDTYNFVIARSRDSDEIHAIEGFIPTSQFDPSIVTPMTWGAIWKTRETVAPPGLGVVVKQYREHQYPTPYAMEVGISGDASRYNTQMGNTVFELEPWYMVNPYVHEYALMVADSRQIGFVPKSCVQTPPMVWVEKADWFSMAELVDHAYIPPFKSVIYYFRRYFSHPIYHYEAVLLQDSSGKQGEVIFYRVVSANGHKCIFIVDYIGNGKLLGISNQTLIDLMVKYEAEYILFLCSGISAMVLRAAGFSDRREGEAVIPVYFEPFVCQNVNIYCTQRVPLDWPTFKGDADQDRPSILR